jgi:apolipoprotein N-acyltransferase
MLSLALYLIGSMVCIAGLSWIATSLGAAHAYVTPLAGVLFAAAIYLALAYRRLVQPPPTS